MIRLFISPERISPDAQNIALLKREQHYLLSVMRLKENEMFHIFDGNGVEYTAAIEKMRKKNISAKILSRTRIPLENKPAITLALCLLKGEKMDMVLQKATELGVHEVLPVLSARAISRVKPGDFEKKKTRYVSILTEAAEQCGRATLPIMQDITDLKMLGQRTGNFYLSLFFNENEKQSALKNVLEKNKTVSSILFLVGPEGGFTEDEAQSLAGSGFVSVSLGKNILRSETACLFGLSVLSYVFST